MTFKGIRTGGYNMVADKIIESGSSYGYNTGESYINPHIQPVVLDVCALYKAKRIICIGRNNDALRHYLKNAGYAVYGIELGGSDEANYAELTPTKKSGEFGILNNPDKLKKASFDTAISTEFGEHCSEAVKFAAQNLHYGGILILSTPCVGYLKSLLATLHDRWNQRHSRPRAKKIWSRKHLKVLLEFHGFNVSELIGIRHHAFQHKELVWVARKMGRPKNADSIKV